MILYHGSYAEIKKPVLSFSREKTDFNFGRRRNKTAALQQAKFSILF